MEIDQVAIALLGVAAAWLSQARSHASRRFACIFGLIAQPFAFYAAWQSGRWALLVVALLYLCAWLRGLWVYWLAGRTEAPRAALGTIQLTPGRGS